MNLIAKLIFAFAFFVSSSFADEIDDLKKIIEEQRAVIESLSEGIVTSVTANRIVVTNDKGITFTHELYKYTSGPGHFF